MEELFKKIDPKQILNFLEKRKKQKQKKKRPRIKDVGWCLIRFYGISTIVGYSMPNPIYTYQIYMICKQILLIAFLNELKLIFLHTGKWFQVVLSNTKNSIYC